MAEEQEEDAGTVSVTVGEGGAGSAADTGNMESEARAMGWVPKDEWKGDPDKWRPASEFVQRGEEILPIVRSLLTKERAKNARLERRVEESTAALKRVDRMAGIALERQREQIVAEYEARKEKAVESGDTDAYRKASEGERAALNKLDEKTKEATKDAEPGTKAGISKADADVLEDWMDDNTWFKSDPEMTVFADRKWDRYEKDNPDASFADKLAHVRDEVEKKFPAKFGKKSAGNGSSAVESGSRVPGGGSDQKLSSKLPKEVRPQMERDIKQGLYKSAEEWAEVYFQSEG